MELVFSQILIVLIGIVLFMLRYAIWNAEKLTIYNVSIFIIVMIILIIPVSILAGTGGYIFLFIKKAWPLFIFLIAYLVLLYIDSINKKKRKKRKK